MDKSLIIDKVNERIHTKNRCLCITKPRRFGKTSVLNMLGAYYGKSYPSSAIFDRLKISHCKSYTVHLNQYNIINLNMNCLPDNGNSYSDYTALIKGTIEDDIEALYPELKRASFRSLPDLLTATKDEFIFFIDEWDYIFSHDLYRENHSDFLEFLRYLLKDRPYVALAYMTGVLPIKKYSTGSALNMFDEYTMLNDSFLTNTLDSQKKRPLRCAPDSRICHCRKSQNGTTAISPTTAGNYTIPFRHSGFDQRQMPQLLDEDRQTG